MFPTSVMLGERFDAARSAAKSIFSIVIIPRHVACVIFAGLSIHGSHTPPSSSSPPKQELKTIRVRNDNPFGLPSTRPNDEVYMKVNGKIRGWEYFMRIKRRAIPLRGKERKGVGWNSSLARFAAGIHCLLWGVTARIGILSRSGVDGSP